MKKAFKFLLSYALIPLIASLPGLALGLCGLTIGNLILVPGLTLLIYILFRKKIDLGFAAKINGFILLLLVVIFTVMMAIASGSVEGRLLSNYYWLLLPFAPVMLVPMITGQTFLFYLISWITYAVDFIVTAILGKVKIKRIGIPIAVLAVCFAACTVLYCNRPAVKYAGHGFEYMHGYSSTDFSEYMVYDPDSKLAVLDGKPSLIIENEKDMPVLDGAEACYPMYAAFAKAAYKDIDLIEENWMKKTDNPYTNGKIVSFTNTVRGFQRLLLGEAKSEFSEDGIDMFFGARPSPSQLQDAKDMGVELVITPIAREAFVFFVEEDNPVDNLTTDQIKAIYHGDITNWKELGEKNQKMMAFQRPKNSGSQTIMEYFMGDTPLKDPQTYEIVSAMDGVIRQVAQYNNEDGAIGYSFRYFLEELVQEKGVKMLAVDGVYPSLENIENGTYPLTTDVCLITRKNDPNPFVQKMTDFILSEEGQSLIRSTGYGSISENPIS